MKQNRLISIILAAVLGVSGCHGIYSAEQYNMPVDPYVPVSEVDIKFGECTIDFGDKVSVNGEGAWYKDGDILISEGGVYKITGTYSGGGIKISATDPVKLIFESADITSTDDYAVTSKAERLIICSDSSCILSGCGGDFGNAVYSAGALMFAGTGSMDIEGGVFSAGGIRFGRNVSTLCEILQTDDGDLIAGNLSIN